MNSISEDVNQVRLDGGPAIMYGIQTLITFRLLVPLMFIKSACIGSITALFALPILSCTNFIRQLRSFHKRVTVCSRIFYPALSTLPRNLFRNFWL